MTVQLSDAKRAAGLSIPGVEWRSVGNSGEPDPADLFVVRQPVPLPFIGTRTFSPALTRDQQIAEERASEENFRRGLAIASQVPEISRLLERGICRGFSVGYDAVETQRQNVVGFLDWPGDVPLLWMNPQARSSDPPPLRIARNLVHESEHVEHVSGGLNLDWRGSLASAIKIIRAQEAAARAMSLFMLGSLIIDRPGDPTNRLKPEGLTTALQGEPASLCTAFEKGLGELKAGRADQFMERMFLAFYKDEKTVASYDRTAISFYQDRLDRFGSRYTPNEAGLFMHSRRYDHARITGILSFDGKPYLQHLAKGLLDSPDYAGLSNAPAVLEDYARLVDSARKVSARYGCAPDLAIPIRYGAEDPVRQLAAMAGPRPVVVQNPAAEMRQ